MVRWLVIGGVAVLALTVYALVDLFVTAGNRLRAFKKPVWIAVIVALPVIGPVLWLAIGKSRPSSTTPPVAPDDDPRFLGNLSETAEERIKRLEEELRALHEEAESGEGDDGEDGPPNGTSSPKKE